MNCMGMRQRRRLLDPGEVLGRHPTGSVGSPKKSPNFSQTAVTNFPSVKRMTLPLSRAVLALPTLSSSAKLLHAVLTDRATADGSVRVRVPWLAVQVGLTRRRVHGLLHDLENAGLIQIQPAGSEPTYYRLLSL